MNQLDILNQYPSLSAIGRERIQALCDQWLKNPVAQEFGVTAIQIDEVNSKLLLAFSCEIQREIDDGESYLFPLDQLLIYIAKHGLSDEQEKMGAIQDVEKKRRPDGPNVYQRFIIRPGPNLPVSIICKNSSCNNPMLTQIRKYRNQMIEHETFEVKCPRCNETKLYDHNDFTHDPPLRE